MTNGDVMWIIYLTALGLCTWYGPVVAAVLDKLEVEVDIDRTYATVGFIIGLIPVINIWFVMWNVFLITDIHKALRAKKNGDEEAVPKLNQKLREKYSE